MTRKKEDKGKITVIERKNKREIIQEGKKKVNIPPLVGDEEEKALNQKGEDATGSW